MESIIPDSCTCIPSFALDNESIPIYIYLSLYFLYCTWYSMLNSYLNLSALMVNPWILPCSYTRTYFSVFLWPLALKLLHCWLYKTYALAPLFKFCHHPVTMNQITDDVLKCLDIYDLLNISLDIYYLAHCCLCLNNVGDTSWLTCLLTRAMAMKLLLVVYQLIP